MKTLIFLVLLVVLVPSVLGVRQLNSITLTSPTNNSAYSESDTFTFTCQQDYGGGSPSGTTGNGNWTYCSGSGCTPTTLLTTGTTDLTGTDADGLYSCTNCGDASNSQTITTNNAGDYGIACFMRDQDGPTLTSGVYRITVTSSNVAPKLSSLRPLNNSVVVRSNSIVLNATYTDIDSDLGTVSFTNASNNVVWCTNTSISSGTVVRCRITYNDGDKIRWYVNATDSQSNKNSSGTYNFSVTSNNIPSLTLNHPQNNSLQTNGSITLNLTYTDSDSDLATVTFYNQSNGLPICTNNSVTTGSRVNCVVSLPYSQKLKWYATANDGWDTYTTGVYNYSTIKKPWEVWTFNLTDTSQTGTYNLTMVWVNDTNGAVNITKPNITFETTGGADSCTYSSGNWLISCSDNCNIADTDISGNNAYITGTGTFNWIRNITNANKIKINGGCQATW